MDSIVAGDVVTLKSGSPKFTVEKIRWFGYADITTWMEDSGETYQSQYFYKRCIRLAALVKV